MTVEMDNTGIEQFHAAVDALESVFVERLRKAVSIASVSSDANLRSTVVEMGGWLVSEMEKLGVSAEKREIGEQLLEGRTIPLPPIILGRYGNDSSKKTVLVYGHYDVQPAAKSDGWNTEPFELQHDAKTGRMYGRGSSDDKGPVLGWLNAIEAYQKAGLDFPVNLLMCFEGMEEYGSEGLDDFIQQEAQKYFKDVDCVCISDNYWLGTQKPCLTYGLRGCIYYKIDIQGPAKDLHSGLFGGVVHEPMTDLVYLMSSLVAPDGKILIPGLADHVQPLTATEEKLYDSIAFGMDEFYSAVGAESNIYPDSKTTLMHSLSLHGIEGAFSAPGAKTVIPAKVLGKFSIRTVPDLDPNVVTDLVKKHLSSKFKQLNSKNNFHVEVLHSGNWWVTDPKHWNYEAGARAVKKVFGVNPDLTREGGSIPVTLTFNDALQRNVLLLPMGRGDDGAHSTNEKLDLSNYISGIKLLGYHTLNVVGFTIDFSRTYLYEIKA